VRRGCAALLVLAGLCLSLVSPANAQNWPTRPVRIVNTFAPGGAADILARMVADSLTNAFGQQFFVETHSGAAGVIGVQMVSHAEPDGYNFVITTMSLLVIGPITNAKIGYDPFKDLTNIAFVAGSPIVFVVNPSRGIATLKDFVDYAKRSTKPLTYSSSGVGSNGQLVAETFAQKAGIKVEHVPYKGAAQGLTDLVGGHIDFSSQTLSSASAMVRAGALRAIAHGGNDRVPDYPDVPTFKEAGYDLIGLNWFALAGPAHLPADIRDKVNHVIIDAFSKPDAQERLRQNGLVSQAMTPDEFTKFIEAEIVRWRPAIEAAGLIEK
jgi:tripartite-type tricarboxylate transporter receptor subunit TctC